MARETTKYSKHTNSRNVMATTVSKTISGLVALRFLGFSGFILPFEAIGVVAFEIKSLRLCVGVFAPVFRYTRIELGERRKSMRPTVMYPFSSVRGGILPLTIIILRNESPSLVNGLFSCADLSGLYLHISPPRRENFCAYAQKFTVCFDALYHK